MFAYVRTSIFRCFTGTRTPDVLPTLTNHRTESCSWSIIIFFCGFSPFPSGKVLLLWLKVTKVQCKNTSCLSAALHLACSMITIFFSSSRGLQNEPGYCGFCHLCSAGTPCGPQQNLGVPTSFQTGLKLIRTRWEEHAWAVQRVDCLGTLAFSRFF